MPRRADAIRNRSLLVAAGGEVFAERGPDASLEEIARRAGVGIGTLYRHFPSREALVDAIYAEHIGAVVEVAEEAVADADAWRGLERFLEHVLELQARNLPLRAAFLRQATTTGLVAERRSRILPLLKRMVERAKEQGALRDDLTVGDLSAAIWSFAPIIEATAEVAPDAWRRHLRIVLDGMRPLGATRQKTRPLTQSQLESATDALRGRYHRKRSAA